MVRLKYFTLEVYSRCRVICVICVQVIQVQIPLFTLVGFVYGNSNINSTKLLRMITTGYLLAIVFLNVTTPFIIFVAFLHDHTIFKL